MSENRKETFRCCGFISLVLCLVGLFIFLGCEVPPQTTPQSGVNAPVAVPKPKPAPFVVQLVETAGRGTQEGKDMAILRFFLLSWLSVQCPERFGGQTALMPVDVDYLAAAVGDYEVRGFITAMYYAQMFKPLGPRQLEDPK